MRFMDVLKKFRKGDNEKSRPDRDFRKWQEENRKQARDIAKQAADDLEAIGYFMQPIITLNPEERISRDSAISCRAGLDLIPMTREVYEGLKKEREDDEIREGLICEADENCGKPHENCPHPVSLNRCKDTGIESCGKCLTWAADERKKAKEQEITDAELEKLTQPPEPMKQN